MPFDELTLNADQYAFKELCVRFANSTLMGKPFRVKTERGAVSGRKYTDYVITVVTSDDRDTIEVFRNRTGKLVFAMYNGKLSSIHWEYIFVDDHMVQKLEKINEPA